MIVSDERVARFVSERLGLGLCPPYVAIGTERRGEIVNGVLLNVYEGASIHVTAAGGGWSRGLLSAVGRYVFDQLGCERMTAITRCDDVAQLARRLGGVVEGRMRSHFGPGQDGIVLGILREDYRY